MAKDRRRRRRTPVPYVPSNPYGQNVLGVPMAAGVQPGEELQMPYRGPKSASRAGSYLDDYMRFAYGQVAAQAQDQRIRRRTRDLRQDEREWQKQAADDVADRDARKQERDDARELNDISTNIFDEYSEDAEEQGGHFYSTSSELKIPESYSDQQSTAAGELIQDLSDNEKRRAAALNDPELSFSEKKTLLTQLSHEAANINRSLWNLHGGVFPENQPSALDIDNQGKTVSTLVLGEDGRYTTQVIPYAEHRSLGDESLPLGEAYYSPPSGSGETKMTRFPTNFSQQDTELLKGADGDEVNGFGHFSHHKRLVDSGDTDAADEYLDRHRREITVWEHYKEEMENEATVEENSEHLVKLEESYTAWSDVTDGNVVIPGGLWGHNLRNVNDNEWLDLILEHGGGLLLQGTRYERPTITESEFSEIRDGMKPSEEAVQKYHRERLQEERDRLKAVLINIERKRRSSIPQADIETWSDDPSYKSKPGNPILIPGQRNGSKRVWHARYGPSPATSSPPASSTTPPT